MVVFFLQVNDRTGANGQGSNYSTFDDFVTLEAFTLRYRSFNVYGSRSPSISKVFFLITSTQKVKIKIITLFY